MNAPALSPSPSPSPWIAVCRASNVRAKPYRVEIDGMALVLFRSAQGLAAFPDICPHRLAPLSRGRIVAGQLECAYHGWRFDGAGQCQAMPGLIGEVPRVRLAPWQVREQDGLIFVAREASDTLPYGGRLTGTGMARVVTASETRSTVAEVAENILDATHTHFIHKGLLRGLSSRRYRVIVTLSGGPGWVEARYEGETRQEGVLSRLLEGQRGISVGRFLAPGIAEIEFWSPRRIELATTFHLRQAAPDCVAGLGVLAGPGDGGLGWVKAALFRPLFDMAVAQDRHILAAVTDNRARFDGIKPVIGPLDLLRPSIDAILAGELPPLAGAPRTVEIEL